MQGLKETNEQRLIMVFLFTHSTNGEETNCRKLGQIKAKYYESTTKFLTFSHQNVVAMHIGRYG